MHRKNKPVIRNKPHRRISLEVKEKLKASWEAGVSSLQLEDDFDIRAGSIRTMAKRGGWKRPEVPKDAPVEVLPVVLKQPGLPERLVEQPEQLAAFMGVLNDGGSLQLACRFSGLPRATVDDWLASRPDFAAQVEKAKADSAVRALKALNRHLETDWKPASHVLAHNPFTREDWTPTPGTSKGGINIVIKFDRYAEDEPVTIDGTAEPGGG